VNSGDAAYVGAVEQQHSARNGRKGPGQAQGQGNGRKPGHDDQGDGPGRRKRGKPEAAAAAPTHGDPSAQPSAAGSPSPSSRESRESPSSRESRRRADTDATRQEAAALYHAQLRFPLIPARLTDALSWLPRARLTALGSGLLAVLLMAMAGGIDKLFMGSSTTLYGSAFLLVCVICAAWVRPADLFTAPVSAPLAFTAGIAFISGDTGSEGFMGRLTSLFPALAVNAVWLYAGTLASGLVVLVRKLALVVQRSRARAFEKAQEEAEGDVFP
jgi:hypothetical protein